MKFAAAGSQDPDLATAIHSICQELHTQLPKSPADLTLVFTSHQHQPQAEEIVRRLEQEWPSRVLLGTTAETVVCGAEEQETGPALAIWTASLPEYRLSPFALEFESTPDGVISLGIPEDLEGEAAQVRAFLILGEPYSTAPHALIQRFANDFPDVPIVGGMASGAAGPDENRLLFNNTVLTSGAIAVALLDGPPVTTLVSQGCRPVGEPFVVTRAEKNVVMELGGRPALIRLQEVYQAATAADRQLLEAGLLLGVAMTEYRDSFGRGDFLVANVLGADRGSGAMATGLPVRMGQTVQFHIRDAESADEDLRQMLMRLQNVPQAAYAGGLIFSCNGRGSRMFATPHHDAAAIQQHLGPLPLAGMFAAGEIGPVGRQTYLHGYTASAIFFGEH